MIILEERKTEFGTIKICESKTDRARTYYQDEWSQSMADSNGHSLISYIHAMAGTMLHRHAQKIAVLGCAGGTLSTMLIDAGCDVTTVDINPHTFDIAERYFHFPHHAKRVIADARHYLETTAETFDAIALDVFDNGTIPLRLRSVEFFRIAQARLNPGGLLLVNAIVDHDLDLHGDHIAATLHAATALPVIIFDHPETPDRNIVIIAGRISALQFPQGNEPDAVQKDLAKMIFRPARTQACAYYDTMVA